MADEWHAPEMKFSQASRKVLGRAEGYFQEGSSRKDMSLLSKDHFCLKGSHIINSELSASCLFTHDPPVYSQFNFV